jgi:hypothetical protein
MPQVGYKFDKAVVGYSVYNAGILSQLTLGPFCNDTALPSGGVIQTQCGVFLSPVGILNLNGEIDVVPRERDRVGDKVIDSDLTVYYNLSLDPGRVISRITLSGFVGDKPDVANARPGRGADVQLTGTLKPTDHLAFDLNAERQWLNVDIGEVSGRLFTAQIGRLKGSYNFTSHAFLRLIGQYYTATRNQVLYEGSVSANDRSFTGSALFAYTPDWQTVLYLGYGDSRALNAANELVPAGRQFFLKVSYAFQQ